MLIAPLVSASTIISFSNVGMDPDNIIINNASGDLYGTYNTSSKAISLQDNASYSILVVPANDNLLGNHPDTWFDHFVAKAQQNIIPILLLCFVVVMLGVAWSRR